MESRDQPAVHGEDHGEEGCASAAHGGPGGATIHLETMEELMPEQIDAQKRL